MILPLLELRDVQAGGHPVGNAVCDFKAERTEFVSQPKPYVRSGGGGRGGGISSALHMALSLTLAMFEHAQRETQRSRGRVFAFIP